MHSDSLNTTPEGGSPDELPVYQKQRLNKRQELADDYDGGLLFLSEPEYDDAIIGVARRIGMEEVVAYDANKVYEIIAKMMNTDDMMEVFEYFEFNILGAYVGERTPVFIDVV
jgi:hypothetical protein